MDSSVMLTKILSMSFVVCVIDLTSIFVKFILESFRSIFTLCSLSLLGIIGSQENCLNSGIALGEAMELTPVAVVIGGLPVYSFFKVWRKYCFYHVTQCSVIFNLLRGVTFVTTIGLLEALNIEFGGHMEVMLSLTRILTTIFVCLLVWVFFSHRNNTDTSLKYFTIKQMPVSAFPRHRFLSDYSLHLTV